MRSFGSIHFLQMEIVLRQMAQASDLLSEKAKLRTQGWSQRGCIGPLILSLSHENLGHGARGSLHLCPCVEVLVAPDVQILPILIR